MRVSIDRYYGIIIGFIVPWTETVLGPSEGGLVQVVLVQLRCSFSTKKSAQEKSVPEKSVVF